MKLSIWQQFSSNNSSSYVIVGAFETPQKAHEAAEKFKALLQRIWEWYKAHPEAREVVDSGDRELTDVEREVMHDHNIEFEEALDWVAREESLDFLPDAVAVFENLVFVATVDETETKDTPLAQYMHQLGADMKYEEAMRTGLSINVSGTAPDDTTAQYIKASTETYLFRDRGTSRTTWTRPPWVAFYDGQLVPNPEQFNRDNNTYFANLHAQDAWDEDHKVEINNLTTQWNAALFAKDNQTVNKLNEQIGALFSKRGDVEPYLSRKDFLHISKIIGWVTTFEGEKTDVVIEETRVHIRDVRFLHSDIGHGLPAIVTWMRALGCVDVTYEFVVMPRY